MGPTYRERLKYQVSCGKCGEMLEVGYLSSHLMTQHGREAGRRRQWNTPAVGSGPWSYRMSFPAKGGPQKCPVSGCPGRVVTRTSMQVHFVHRHVLDTVVIPEEGNSPHPRCARCDIQVPQRALNGLHPGTSQCHKGAEQKRRRLAEADTRENTEQAFEAYGAPIESVIEFKYLGRILTATDNDWPVLVRNLGKVRRSWGRLSRVIGKEGADLKVSRAF